LIVPTALIAGQSVWRGCGADIIWCGRLSWFTNATRAPIGTRSSFGLAPVAVMVTVNPAGVVAGGPPGELGAPGPPPEPPHAASTSTTIAAAPRRER
jgi:hypothetical protein